MGEQGWGGSTIPSDASHSHKTPQAPKTRCQDAIKTSFSSRPSTTTAAAAAAAACCRSAYNLCIHTKHAIQAFKPHSPSQHQHAVLNPLVDLPPAGLATGRLRPRFLPRPDTFILRYDATGAHPRSLHRRPRAAAPLLPVHEPDNERGALDIDRGERSHGVAASSGGTWHDVWIFG